MAILILSHGAVEFLVVLYSINVFLTFSLSLTGLCIYWIKHCNDDRAGRDGSRCRRPACW